MEWFRRRILKRIKQKHPIEVYVNGRLVIAGPGVIKKDLSRKYDSIVGIERYTK